MNFGAGSSTAGTADKQLLRARPRRKIFYPTQMRIGLWNARVHLLDLSASGALVHCATPIAMGTLIRIECAGMARSARVVWSEGERFGVQFFAPLSDAQVDAALAG